MPSHRKRFDRLDRLGMVPMSWFTRLDAAAVRVLSGFELRSPPLKQKVSVYLQVVACNLSQPDLVVANRH